MWWVVSWLACAGAPADSDGCDDGTGEVTVCVLGYYGEAAGADVRVTADDGGGPIEARTGDDGCVTYTLPAGDYALWARDEAVQCETSSTTPVTVAACEALTVDLTLDACFGR